MTVIISRELKDGTHIRVVGNDPRSVALEALDAERMFEEDVPTSATEVVDLVAGNQAPATLIIMTPDGSWVDGVLFFSSNDRAKAAQDTARAAGLTTCIVFTDEEGAGGRVDPDVFVMGGLLHVRTLNDDYIFPSDEDPQF